MDIRQVIGKINKSKMPQKVEQTVQKCFAKVHLSEELHDKVVQILNFILVSSEEKNYINYNVLIRSLGAERTEEFISALQNAIRTILGSSCRILNLEEKQFLDSCTIEDEQLQFVFVKGFSREYAEEWLEKSADMDKTPSIIRMVICESKEDIDHFSEYSHLFYRVLSQHITILDYTWQDVFEESKSLLKEEGYIFADGYGEELSEYVETVYPKADLQGKAFEKDLIRRIVDLCRSINLGSKTLDSNCIPKYKKNTASESEPVSEGDGMVRTEVVLEDNTTAALSDNLVLNEYYSTVPQYKVLQDGDETLEIISSLAPEEEISVLLLPLSTFGKMTTYQYYVEDTDTNVHGTYQLDPVMNYLKLQNRKFDCVILLASQATMDIKEVVVNEGVKNEKGKYDDKLSVPKYKMNTSPLNYFAIEHQSLLKQQFGDSSELIVIPAEIGESVATLEKAVVFLRRLSMNNHVNITMDNHGGLRNQQVYVQAIMSLMQHENIDVTEAYTVEFGNRYRILKDESFNIFNLVSAINEFLYFGRMESIERYYHQLGMVERPKLLNIIKTISEGIQAGNVYLFEQGVEDLQACYMSKEIISNGYLKLFQNQIYDSYGPLLERKNDVRDYIRWCMKTGLYQQALTFIEARVPEFLLEMGCVAVDENQLDEYKKARKEADGKKYKDNGEVLVDCWNSNVDGSRILHYSWLSNGFNAIFANDAYNRTTAFQSIQKIVSKDEDRGTCEQLVGMLFTGEVKHIGYTPFTNSIEKDATYLCSFYLLYKTLKQCRNTSNHLKRNKQYSLEAVKNAIDLFLSMLDEVVESMKEEKTPELVV